MRPEPGHDTMTAAVAVIGSPFRSGHIPWRELDAVEVARQRSVGIGHEQTTDVRELLCLNIPLIGEPGRRGHPANRVFVTGQEVPAVRRASHIPVIEMGALLGVRGLRRVARVETHEHDIELFAGRERQHLQRR